MAVLEEIIQQSNDSIECFVGGMGKFDDISASAVRNLKKKYKERQIKLVLVLPYTRKSINEYKTYYETMYDEIVIPSNLDGIHYKRAIVLRNRWMVDRSDYLIAMVQREYGGAYDTLKYAKKIKKCIIYISG